MHDVQQLMGKPFNLNKTTFCIKRVLTVGALSILASSSVLAYELGTICKESTQGWMRLSGTCDNEGYLQGRGVATMGDLAVFGDFNKGLPNGGHHIVFADKRQFEKGNVERFVNERLGGIAFLNGTKTHNSQGFAISAPTDICKINFVNGQPADNILNCSGINVKAKLGNVRMVSSNGSVEFSISEADISGQSTSGYAPILDLDRENPQPISLTGSADSVTLSRRQGKRSSSFQIANLNGTATFPPRPYPYSNRKTTHSVKGVFNVEDNVVVLRTIKWTYTPEPAKPASEDVKYDFDVWGRKFKAAFYDNSTMVAKYIKIENDVEFDGSGYELCLNSPSVSGNGNLNPAGAVEVLYRDRDGTIDIKPKCGKITDKTGRSYSGFFDKDGRPTSR